MSIRQDIEDLLKINRQLKDQKRTLLIYEVLELVLVGFFLSKRLSLKVAELSNKKNGLINRIKEYFEQLNKLKQHLEELKNIDGLATKIEEKNFSEKLFFLKQDLMFLVSKEVSDAFASLEDKDRKVIDGTIQECIKKYLELKNIRIDEQIQKITNSNTYLIYSEKGNLSKEIESFTEDIGYFRLNNILTELCSEIRDKIMEYSRFVSRYNNEFVEHRKKEYAYIFRKNGFSLDEEQKNAVVKDDKHNLVVAGAGSGKTEVLITRIAYLIKRKPDAVMANRILAIAYQNKDVNQIQDRLRWNYGIDNLEVKTFHKLGKEILQKAGEELNRNSIIDENKKNNIIRSLFRERLSQREYYSLFLEYVKTLHDDEKADMLEIKAENLAYAEKRPYFAVNNVKVKSKAEKEIMDFFLTNKLNNEFIAIEYEPDVEGFRPDFKLTKNEIFIEHWGLNEQGDVPSWFDISSEEYKAEMQFKRQWFASHNKLLVEMYAYEYDPANPSQFLELLKKRVIEKLESIGLGKSAFTPLSYDELVEVAWGPYKDPVDELVNFITIAKTFGLSPERIHEKLLQSKWSSKQLAFGKMVLEIYNDYANGLSKNGKIDFEDMINNALEELDADQALCANIYDQILIDEYQDVSAQRYKLIKKLLERNLNCKLFCVGDDWQSIMGFSGSNLDFFVNFEKYFDNPEVTKIATNYRSIKTIVDAGACLISNNNDCQIQKTTRSNVNDERLIQVLYSPHKEYYRKRYLEQIADDCLVQIKAYLEKGVLPKDILVLSRFMRTRLNGGYRFHPMVKILQDKAYANNMDLVFDDARSQSKVRVLTVHKSKGLEAKVVFLLNVIKDKYGFPCEIEDSSIYDVARENYPEQKHIDEERRLFYVALTRAKEDLIIYTWEPLKSCFLYEIEGFTEEQRLNY